MKHPIVSISPYQIEEGGVVINVVDIKRRVKYLSGWHQRMRRRIYYNVSDTSYLRCVRVNERLYVHDESRLTSA